MNTLSLIPTKATFLLRTDAVFKADDRNLKISDSILLTFKMNLQMRAELADAYNSPAQKARVVTEDWISRELYCPSCLSTSITPTIANNRAIDFYCPICTSPFQLKSSKSGLKDRVPDGAYTAMISAIRQNRTPNLLLLNYNVANWAVSDLLFIPKFAFSEQAILRRKPLAQNARRSGWVGCNINLSAVLPDARIPIVKNGVASPVSEVRDAIAKISPLADLSVKDRSWTYAVLIEIKSMKKPEFTTACAYAIEGKLAEKFPNNRNVRPKIRQKLQVLRDLGFLEHVSRGTWRLL